MPLFALPFAFGSVHSWSGRATRATFPLMANRDDGEQRPIAASGKEFLRLGVACARAQRALGGKTSVADAEAQQRALDSVAYALAMVAPVYATDSLTSVLFPISEAEILRGSFKGGATQFVRDGEVRYTGLFVTGVELDDALRVLGAAAKARIPQQIDSKADLGETER